MSSEPGAVATGSIKRLYKLSAGEETRSLPLAVLTFLARRTSNPTYLLAALIRTSPFPSEVERALAFDLKMQTPQEIRMRQWNGIHHYYFDFQKRTSEHLSREIPLAVHSNSGKLRHFRSLGIFRPVTLFLFQFQSQGSAGFRATLFRDHDQHSGRNFQRSTKAIPP